MQLKQSTRNIESNIAAENSEFSLKTSSKAFSILSSGLYANKIGAIVRELCCNALDAHRMAGKKDVPFEVDLPREFDLNFTVRDFGVGLSDEDVKGIYTTYFASTKDQSNEDIGAMGLGSKTPLCYTDSFTIVSRYEGMERTYLAYVGATGKPVISLLAEKETDAGNGVEVSVSVKDKDVRKFHRELASQLRYFESKPTVNVPGFTFERVPEYSITGDGWAIHSKREPSKVIMGQVAYPLDISQLGVEGLDRFDHGIDLYVGIGEVDVAASRESLSYDKETIRRLALTLPEIKDTLVNRFKEEVEANCNSLLEAIDYVDENAKPIARMVGLFSVDWDGHTLHTRSNEYSSCAPFPLCDIPSVIEFKRINYIIGERANYSGILPKTPPRYTKKMNFIIPDTARPRAYKALRKMHTDGYRDSYLVLIKTDCIPKKSARRQAFFEAYRNRVRKAYGGLSAVYLASEISVPHDQTGKKKTENNPLFSPRSHLMNGDRRGSLQYAADDWDSRQPADIDKGGLYVNLEYFTPTCKDEIVGNLGKLIAQVERHFATESLKVYGARKKSKLPNHPKWENLFDFCIRKIRRHRKKNPDAFVNMMAVRKSGLYNKGLTHAPVFSSREEIKRINCVLDGYPRELPENSFWRRLDRLTQTVAEYDRDLVNLLEELFRYCDMESVLSPSDKTAIDAKANQLLCEFQELKKQFPDWGMVRGDIPHMSPDIYAGFIYANEMLKQEKA